LTSIIPEIHSSQKYPQMKCVADKFQQNSSFIAQYENSSELPQSAAVDQSLHSLLFTSNDESFFDITPYPKGVLRIVQKKEFPYRSKKGERSGKAKRELFAFRSAFGSEDDTYRESGAFCDT
jgi:hypothetical protein